MIEPREFWIKEGHGKPDWIMSEKPDDNTEKKYGPFRHVIDADKVLEKIARLEKAISECEKIFKDPVCSSYKAIARFEYIKESILEGR